jgi:hypothetical protein
MTSSPLAEAFVPRAGEHDAGAGGFPDWQFPIFAGLEAIKKTPQ